MRNTISNTRAWLRLSKKRYAFLFFLGVGFANAAALSGTFEFPAGYPEKNGAVIWLEGSGANFAATKMSAEIDQSNMSFSPYLTVVTAGSTLVLHNSDPNLHMVKSQNGPLAGMRTPMIPVSSYVKIPVKGAGVSEILCDIHSQMRGYVVSVPNDHFAISDAKGKFTIKNAPPPPYTVKVWHDVLPPLEFKVDTAKEIKKFSQIKMQVWK